MSKRENIASDIITKLDAVTSPIEFKKITREPFEVEELSDAQFPALFVQSGDETREVSSIGDTGAGKSKVVRPFFSIGDKEEDKIKQEFASTYFKEMKI